MQIANGVVILSPENQQHKHGVTPGEALILYRMHHTNSNGTPLGTFFIQDGEAETVDKEGKPAEEEFFNQTTGRHVAAKTAVPAVTHKRTQAEEIARLKRKYTGNITQGGVAKTAFIATFGDGMVKLPETFEEIEPMIGGGDHPDGYIFRPKDEEPKKATEKDARKLALLAMKRPELCALAVDTHKLKLKVSDSNDDIASAIMEAEEKLAAKAKEAEEKLAAKAKEAEEKKES